MPLRPVTVLSCLQPVLVTLIMACQVAEHVGLGIVLIEVAPDGPKPTLVLARQVAEHAGLGMVLIEVDPDGPKPTLVLARWCIRQILSLISG
jgi:hypothetical protein